MAGA
ncbi:hypothetical protein VCHC41A1_2972, partial [Vibrio cholerae HC-41A1]|jgi:deazaflavin-dependent oxidoreductase (nitroreductase family)